MYLMSLQSNLLPFATPSRTHPSKPSSLVEAVKVAVQNVVETCMKALSADRPSLAFQPRVLLGVLTYCYARGVFSSAEVLDCLARDEYFCRACHDQFPTPGQIRQFRDLNREPVQGCLAFALQFLAEQQVAEGFVARANKTFVADEAKRRIIMAACMDSLELTQDNPFPAMAH